MAKLLTEEANYSDIAGAIRAQLDVGTSYLPSEMAAAISSIGAVTNGVLEQYVSQSEIISPFTFVEFVENLAPVAYDGTILSEVGLNGANKCAEFVAVAVDSTHAVLFEGYDAEVLLATPLTISGNDITVEQYSVVSVNYRYAQVDTNNGGLRVSASLLSGNRIFVAYSTETGMAAKVCTLSNNTITSGSEVSIRSELPTWVLTAAVNDNIIVCTDSRAGGMYNLSVNMCTISGTTITKETGYIITWPETVTDGSIYQSAGGMVALDNSRVFMAKSSYAMVFSISGTVVTGGTAVQYDSSSSGHPSVVLLGANKTLISYPAEVGGNSSRSLKSVVCNISGTTITPATPVTLTTGTPHVYCVDVMLTSENEFVVSYNDHGAQSSANNNVFFVSGVVENDSIIFTKEGSCLIYQYGSNSILKSPLRTVALSSNQLLIARAVSNSTQGDGGMVCLVTPYASSPAVVESQTKIDGISYGSITPSIAGGVYRLNTNA